METKSVKVVSLIFSFFLMISSMLLLPSCDSSNTEKKSLFAQIKEDGYVCMATNAEFEPFEFVSSDGVEGIDIEISKKIAEKMGVELRIVDGSFTSVMLEITKKRCGFAAAALSYSEEKEEHVDFSDSYFTTRQAIIVRNNSSIACTEDLQNKKIGVQIGTTGDSFCTDNVKGCEVVRFSKPMNAIMGLKGGSLDAVVVDNFPADKFVDANRDSIKKLPEPLTTESYVIAIPKGEIEIKNIINEVIKEIKENGELDRIVHNFV